MTTVHQFSNGLTLIHRRNPATGIVALSTVFQPGAKIDPEEQSGRMNLMVRMLSKGTASRSADEIAERFESLGARYGAGTNYDFVSATLQATAEDFGPALEVFSDVLLNPEFPLDEIRTERSRVLTEIRVKADRPATLAMRGFREALFAPGPYGAPLDGTPETVESLTQNDLRAAHSAAIRSDGAILSIVGDITFDRARALVEERFGGMAPKEDALLLASRSYKPAGSLVQTIRPVEQSFLGTGYVTCPLGHEDTPAVDVAGAVLGQGMSSRLFVRLRDERGLAYSVGSVSVGYREAGFFLSYIGTSPGRLCEAVEGIENQLEILRNEPVGEEELERAKAYIIGGYLRDHEANQRQAAHLALWQVMGLGVQYDEKYTEDIRAVTSRDVMRVANKYFTDATTSVVRPEEPVPDCLVWREPEPNWLGDNADERAAASEDTR